MTPTPATPGTRLWNDAYWFSEDIPTFNLLKNLATGMNVDTAREQWRQDRVASIRAAEADARQHERAAIAVHLRMIRREHCATQGEKLGVTHAIAEIESRMRHDPAPAIDRIVADAPKGRSKIGVAKSGNRPHRFRAAQGAANHDGVQCKRQVREAYRRSRPHPREAVELPG